jgi:hypothetical protein
VQTFAIGTFNFAAGGYITSEPNYQVPSGYRLVSFTPQSPFDVIVPVWCKRKNASGVIGALAKDGSIQAMSVCFKNIGGGAVSNVSLSIECYLEKIS